MLHKLNAVKLRVYGLRLGAALAKILRYDSNLAYSRATMFIKLGQLFAHQAC